MKEREKGKGSPVDGVEAALHIPVFQLVAAHRRPLGSSVPISSADGGGAGWIPVRGCVRAPGAVRTHKPFSRGPGWQLLGGVTFIYEMLLTRLPMRRNVVRLGKWRLRQNQSRRLEYVHRRHGSFA